MEDQSELMMIRLRLPDFSQPFSLWVRNAEEERTFREAAKIINNYYNDYKAKVHGVDTATYYAMVAILLGRLYLESTAREQNASRDLDKLEKEIVAYINNAQE